MAHPATGAPLLQVKELMVGYEGVPLAGPLDLTVDAGSIVSLIGPNGAGKSTFLKTVAGQLPPLAGSVMLEGKDLAKLDVRTRARELSVLLTERMRTELLTCRDVVEMGRYPHTGRLGILAREDHERVREAMELVQVWELRERDFMQLSDGQRQRILLARAICQEPRLMVLDEPTSYLDIRYQIELLELLRQLTATRGVGIIMALHELPLAWQVSDLVVCVRSDGSMLQGPPSQMLSSAVIDELFELEPGSYDPLTGSIRLRQTAVPAGEGSGHAAP